MPQSELHLIDPLAVKRESERVLVAANARICDWLPHIDHSVPREIRALADRALVLHALLQLAFNAPPEFIRAWILSNQLEPALSASERFILEKEPTIDEQRRTDLKWSMESLWTFMWICGKLPRLDLLTPVGDVLAGLLPDLRANQTAKGFYTGLERRTYAELYAMRDLIFRAHWYARDGNLNGYSTSPIQLDVMMERRKAVEWATDNTLDWDHIDQST